MRLVPLTSIALACALGTTTARADDVTFTGFAHGSETVAFSLVAPNGAASGTVNAGGFATILNGGPSFVSYCVDLGRLYANAGVVDTSVEEAAFQIAVWEIAYETTPGAYALGSGAASFSGGSAANGALGLAATWLAGLGDGAGRSISVIESTEHQDVIFAPVPEPSTYMLMLAGLMATVEISRRKRKQA